MQNTNTESLATLDLVPVLTANITVADDGKPSACYPADEQVRNGAMDYSVKIVLSRDGAPYREIESGITLYPDAVNGGMSPGGSPLDGWCASPIVRWMRTLDRRSFEAAVDALSHGPNETEMDFETTEGV